MEGNSKRWLICLLTLELTAVLSVLASHAQMPAIARRRMKGINSTEQFIRDMLKTTPGQDADLTGEQQQIFGNATVTGSFTPAGMTKLASMVADADVCEPRLSTVVIPPDSNPRVLYWPTCVKLEQCGGCCGHESMACVPTDIETVNVEVMKNVYVDDGDGRYEFMGNVDIPLDKHLACDCRCRVREQDCNLQIHIYDPDTCSCRCINSGQSTSCSAPKIWNEDSCSCICPKLLQCLPDEYFNFNSCSCIRGTPAVGSADTPNTAVNPCPNQTCRINYQPALINGRCGCRPI